MALSDSSVDQLDTLAIGFIGTGRLGKALALALMDRGLKVAGVGSLTLDESAPLAAAIPGCANLTPQHVVDLCDLVFVTTVDGAIESTANALQWRAGSGVVHCSGATEVSSLAKAERDGASIGGFHPMQTFGDPEAARRSLPGCTVTIEASSPLDEVLRAIAGRLECPVNQLPPGMRGRYHAAAGYASQFINVILREASVIWQSWGAQEGAAVKAMLPLVQGTLASIGSAGLAKGMPGPVSRGDIVSIDKHLDALSTLDAPLQQLYREMCGRSIALGLESGGVNAEQAKTLHAMLGTTGRLGT